MSSNFKRAFYTGILVGGILIIINHFDTILYGQITTIVAFKILLTPIVPFIVSYHSAQLAIKESNNNDPSS